MYIVYVYKNASSYPSLKTPLLPILFVTFETLKEYEILNIDW